MSNTASSITLVGAAAAITGALVGSTSTFVPSGAVGSANTVVQSHRPSLRASSTPSSAQGMAPSTVAATVATSALLLGGCALASRRGAAASSARIVSVNAFEGELGVQAPLGFWDPAGLSKDGDTDAFKRRRETEIKHGRVAMWACMGYITPEYIKWPGYCAPSENLTFAEIPNGLGAISKVPGAGWCQIFLFAGLLERGVFIYDDARGPGDYKRGGILGVPNGSGPIADAETRKRKLNSELANGRLAMMAIIGMFYQDGLTGSAWGDWALYTDSPLRAFETELGVQAPVGFWDPAGYTKDGDADAFKRRREVELKHGRIAMFATIGYIVPDYFRFEGYLSPSVGLKFSEMPNGLEAIGKTPPLGIAQWFVFCGLVDFGLYRADPTRGPGDYENAGILGVPNASGPMSDTEGRKKKLNSELANGRLAMMAIMGMMFQNGITGGAGPEMWGFQ